MPQESKAKAPLAPERPPEIEKVPEAPELTPRLPEAAEAPKVPEEIPRKASAPPLVAPTPAALPKDPTLRQIESILEENLQEVYSGLPAELKPQFRSKGEEVARTIREMARSASMKARKVLKLIKGWLKMIPGVSRFFLEQEAAIKAQKIMEIAAPDKSKQK